MNPQLAPTSAFGASLTSHLHIDGERCPFCGQAIPLEKLEEISGKIALREREQALAITTKLEQQYEIEKAQAVASANAALQTRITEAESSKITAEKKGAALLLQLAELQKAREAEVAKVKEDAAAETDAAEALLRDKVAANEKAVAAADAKALEAESKLAALTRQHDALVAESLTSQREVLEKAKDDAINAEKARAFEENQKLQSKFNDLQRAFDKKTNEELGEGAEINLFEALKKEFPGDNIERVGKGTPGADILHVVMLRGKECGTIIYDSKNHKGFRWEHVTKLKADQLAAKAEHAILSTHKFPEGTHQLQNA